jgi:exopolyphosphatase/guanosine-5'-triphosphate,3'-diphosphate pyrophosphatase
MMREAAPNATHTPSTGRDGPILAGVDIGTFTCRLLIARVSHGGLRELQSDRRILCLGEGLQSSGRLLDPAMARVLSTLNDWRITIQQLNVDGEVAVATSAVRDAANREEFLRRVKQDTGFQVELLTGEEEARRTMLGIRSGLPPGLTAVLGLDIGGGSTEFMLDRAGAPRVESVDLGVVRLTEAVLRHDPPTHAEVQDAIAWTTRLAKGVQQKFGDLSQTTLVGTAGTITTLAAMAQHLPQYEPARIHNFPLTLARVLELEQTLVQRTKAQRQRIVGIEPGREDVIVAGTLILRGVMETFGVDQCLVSDLGLREGIVLDFAERLPPTHL